MLAYANLRVNALIRHIFSVEKMRSLSFLHSFFHSVILPYFILHFLNLFLPILIFPEFPAKVFLKNLKL